MVSFAPLIRASLFALLYCSVQKLQRPLWIPLCTHSFPLVKELLKTLDVPSASLKAGDDILGTLAAAAGLPDAALHGRPRYKQPSRTRLTLIAARFDVQL